MGLLSRIAARVKSGLGAVRHEAKHPGKPPSYIEHDSPFYPAPTPADRAGGARPPSAPVSPAATPKPAATASRATASAATVSTAPRRADRGEEKPWFLDGQQDGWDDTNPDAKK